MGTKTVESLEDTVEEVAQVIMRTGLKRLPFRPSQRTMLLMVKAVVAAAEPLVVCRQARAKGDPFLVKVAD